MDTCSICGGPLMYLGCLGRWDWFRCQSCGMEINKWADAYEDGNWMFVEDDDAQFLCS